MQEHSAGWDLPGEQLCERDPRIQVDKQLSGREQCCCCCCAKESQQEGHTGLHQQEHHQQRDRNHYPTQYPSIIFHLKVLLPGHTWNTVFSFGPWYTKKIKKHWKQAKEDAEKGHRDDPRTGKPAI